MAERLNNIVLENARLIMNMLNFSGRAEKYNNEGNRNFGVFIPEERVDELVADGWNIKRFNSDDPDEVGPAFMKVKVSFRVAPPKVVVVKQRLGRTQQLDEDSVSIVDTLDIANCDLEISPYQWEVNGKTGVTAYLKTMYIVAEEDPFELKYFGGGDEPEM